MPSDWGFYLNVTVSDELVTVCCMVNYQLQTFVAYGTVVVSSFTVFFEVVCHVGSSQKFATNFAWDFVLVASQV